MASVSGCLSIDKFSSKVELRTGRAWEPTKFLLVVLSISVVWGCVKAFSIYLAVKTASG